MSPLRLRLFRFVTALVTFGLTGVLGGQLSGAAPAHHRIEASVTAETKALLWMAMAPAEEPASLPLVPLREAWPAPDANVGPHHGVDIAATDLAASRAESRHGPTSLVGVVELRL
jgi:hypothetical protein